jgi:DNA-binding MarR family transcriptional regulator
VCPKDLVTLLRLDDSSISGHLKHLEQGDLITVTPRADGADKRRTLIGMTESGRALLEDLDAVGQLMCTIEPSFAPDDLHPEVFKEIEKAVRSILARVAQEKRESVTIKSIKSQARRTRRSQLFARRR